MPVCVGMSLCSLCCNMFFKSPQNPSRFGQVVNLNNFSALSYLFRPEPSIEAFQCRVLVPDLPVASFSRPQALSLVPLLLSENGNVASQKLLPEAHCPQKLPISHRWPPPLPSVLPPCSASACCCAGAS